MEGEKGNQLDFGWFKMPQTQDGLNSPTGGGEPAGGPAPQDTDIEGQQSDNPQQLPPNACQRPPSNAGQRPPSNACQRPPSNALQRPPSNACQRPPSNACQRPPSNACQRPPSNACQRPPSNACQGPPSNYCSANDAEMAYNRITESGCYELQPPPRSYDENIIIDWPLSNIGEEQVQRFPVPTGNAKMQHDQRPNTSANRLQTPLPPLNMLGYGQERPTYATWRERWHREQHRANDDYDENNNYNDNNSNNNNNISDDVESCLFQHTTDDDEMREKSLLSLQSVNLEDDGILRVADDDHTTRKRRGPYTYKSLDGYQNTVAYTNETKPQTDEFVSSCLTFEVEENNQKRKRSLSRVLVDKLKSLSRWSRWHDAQDDVTCYKYDKLNHDRQN